MLKKTLLLDSTKKLVEDRRSGQPSRRFGSVWGNLDILNACRGQSTEGRKFPRICDL